MRYDRRVIGYHACAKAVSDRVLLEDEPFRPSANDWDWLGHGIYFWEYGYQRAFDWGRTWPRLQGEDVTVVGAIIQLGQCLDLLDTVYTRELAEFAATHVARGLALPPNSGAKRMGDCFLINAFCGAATHVGARFDTVRGLFQEGDPIFEGSGLRRENHIQVVVREPRAIIGLFRPRP
jgi:hypothetical protein